MHRLGASVVGFSDSSNTSLGKKGETLADTISVISTYVDAIVMRHPQEGAPPWRPSFPAAFRY
jgi:aspartate carbamoyltransferase catalytic subunit